MDRRAFLSALSGSFLAAPLAAEAQQAGKVYRIGYLTPFPIDSSLTQSFRQGLRELGYVEGRDVVIEGRSADQRYNDLEKLAAELVVAKVDVLVTAAGVAALAAKRVTATIPIVMAASADAVTQGIVASLARPGGNVTGLTQLSSVLTPKRLEILKETLPRLKRTAALWCPESEISHVELRDSRAAAERLQLQLEPVAYRANASWNAFAETLRLNRPDAIVIFDCPALPRRGSRLGVEAPPTHDQRVCGCDTPRWPPVVWKRPRCDVPTCRSLCR